MRISMQLHDALEQRIVILTVAGRPVPKGRPRLDTRRTSHIYTPQRTQEAEEIMQGEMRQACSVPMDGPLGLSLYFSFRRPNSWRKALRDAVDDGDEPWYTGKPDLDNLIKLVKDAGNKILWLDDAQVVHLEAFKNYGPENETTINLSRLQ